MSERDSICASEEKPEVWKPIRSHIGYEVSSTGRVRSLDQLDAIKRLRRGRVLTNARISGRYMRVRLGRRAEAAVHILVLEAFVGHRPKGMHACHNDGNTRNNTLSNLRWDTPQANQLDKRKHETMAQGSRNAAAKLTEESVAEIWKSPKSAPILAKELNVHQETIGLVRRGKTWGWLTSTLGKRETRISVRSRPHKTHCPRGHELSGDNLRVTQEGSRVVRRCVICTAARQRVQYARKKARKINRSGGDLVGNEANRGSVAASAAERVKNNESRRTWQTG